MGTFNAVDASGDAGTGGAAAASGNADEESGSDATRLAGDKFEAAVLWVKTAVKASATAATDRPPKTHGRKSRSLFIGRLSSAEPESGMNITTLLRYINH